MPYQPGFRPVHKLGRAVSIAYPAAAAVAVVPSLMTMRITLDQLQQLAAGTSTSTGSLSAQLDAILIYAAISVIGSLGVVGVTIAFFVWLWRARTNAEQFSPVRQRFSRGWAIGCWFLPLANVVLSAIVMTDLARAGDPRGPRRRANPLVAATWGVSLLGGLLNTVALVVSRQAATAASGPAAQQPGTTQELLSSLHTGTVLTAVAYVLFLVAVVLFAVLIHRITTQQAQWSGTRPGFAAGAPQGAPIAPTSWPAPGGPAAPGGPVPGHAGQGWSQPR
jgi:heme/copper-type cytochrome/quinol oxidase subunit 2